VWGVDSRGPIGSGGRPTQTKRVGVSGTFLTFSAEQFVLRAFMSRKSKLKAKLLSGDADKNFDWNELCTLSSNLGSPSRVVKVAIERLRKTAWLKSLICNPRRTARLSHIKSGRFVISF
jgi:cell division protein FtsL